MGRDLYLSLARVWNLPDLHTMVNNGREWLLHVLAPLSDISRMMILMIFWRTWFIRNELVHCKPAPPMDVSVRFLQGYVDSLIGVKLNPNADPAKGKSCIVYEAPRPEMARRQQLVALSWKPPMSGWMKLNTDGAFISLDAAGAGMIMRDHLGAINFSACRALFTCRDALEAELCACMEGLSLAIQRTDLPIVVELDSLEAVSLISGAEVDRSVYASIVKEIKHLMSLRQTCITHVSRSQNKASDMLASFARTHGRTMTWLGAGPSEVLEITSDDCKDIVIE